ncbi:MAG: hypothetical protein KJO10_08575 [Gammaproteobacteria bacterium]|nr:hypothetical protein [Gammaproteobacteria bacterium]
MHIVLGALSAIAGLIWALVALQRSGFNPASLNPFLWYRRSQWRKKYGTHPLYNLDDPMDVAAVLILGTAKCEGEISTEQKRTVLEMFEREFKLDNDAAADLLLASAHLIRDDVYLLDRLDNILATSCKQFSQPQAASTLAMMTRIGTFESPLNEEQRKLIVATERFFENTFRRQPQWEPESRR